MGLIQNIVGISADIISKDLMQINDGVIAEQFVWQELLAYSDSNVENRLYFLGKRRKKQYGRS